MYFGFLSVCAEGRGRVFITNIEVGMDNHSGLTVESKFESLAQIVVVEYSSIKCRAFAKHYI